MVTTTCPGARRRTDATSNPSPATTTSAAARRGPPPAADRAFGSVQELEEAWWPRPSVRTSAGGLDDHHVGAGVGQQLGGVSGAHAAG